ncbi:class I SAM-dependent methyltransferase [Echinicola marina]|uniref:class I SAM-dependent methyltransferase n=1 Tax=Echinicola marina TaxID=2859768 RepID=UPI001CF678BD|nr:class I SAM-dependent methyltransferase [Echinicola marina]UCS94191.1 class I SAM-dependent methyltransferase [Echinicola marina]
MDINLYDRVVFFYDRLAALVLGRDYIESKQAFLDQVSAGDKVLYIGGGTGTNLSEILSKLGSNGKVFFVDASQNMISKAANNVPQIFRDRVVFLKQNDFRELPKHRFDVILTQFLLDLLPDSEIEVLFKEIDLRSDHETNWIFTDFIDHPKRKIMQYLMILFFRLLTKNPRKDLPDYFIYFNKYGWEVSSKRGFKGDWIQAWLCKLKN